MIRGQLEGVGRAVGPKRAVDAVPARGRNDMLILGGTQTKTARVHRSCGFSESSWFRKAVLKRA